MNAKNFIGWVAVVLVTIGSGFLAFWGVIEAFHEGWCAPQLGMRMLQLLAYLSMATVLTALTVLGLRWPIVGATLFILTGVTVAALIIIDDAHVGIFITTLIAVVPALVGLLFLYGRPTPLRIAYAVAAGIPLLVVIVFGAEPVFRVSTRFDDRDRGERLVEGNGVTLLWAPAGPGWSREGNVPWEKAVETARHLNDDGQSLAGAPEDIWRLPTREEIVRSLTRHDKNAGGTWDPAEQQATYERKPDKESPLWDSYAPLIYMWTSEEADKNQAWIVVYHGGIYAKSKNLGSPSSGFRAVREPRKSAARPGQDRVELNE